MNEITINIYHPDIVYAKALAKGIASRFERARLRVLGEEDCKTGNCCDVLLLSESQTMDCFDFTANSSCICLLLCDNPHNSESDMHSIFRFESISAFSARLKTLLHMEDCVGLRGIDASGVVFWGVTSGIGGSGTSSLATALGRILSRINQQEVLLVDYGRFPHRGKNHCAQYQAASQVECSDPLSRFVYHIAAKASFSQDLYDACTSCDAYGLRTFHHIDAENILWQLNEEETIQFLECAATKCGCRHIVLDIPPYAPHWYPIVRSCERIIVNYGWQRHRFPSSACLESKVKSICVSDGTCQEERVIPFHPLYDAQTFEFASAESSDAHLSRGCSIDIHGQFGAEVRALVDRLERT